MIYAKDIHENSPWQQLTPGGEIYEPATSLAFNTGMSSAAAIDVLASTAPASQPLATNKRSLDQRMQESHDVRLGQDGGKPASGKSALVNKMTSLYNSTKGEK